MAEIVTEAGLNYLYNAWRVSTAGSLATLWAGLFISQTPSTVPASTASGAAVGWTELSASSGTYARQSITASAITAGAAVGASAWGSTWPAVTFTGFTSASPANGYGIFAGSTGGASASPLFFANFDSGASRPFSSTSDSMSLSPAFRITP